MYHPAPAAAPVQPKAAQPALTDEELFRRDGADFLNYLKNSQGRLGDQADEELVQMRKTCAAIMGLCITTRNSCRGCAATANIICPLPASC